MKPRDIEKGITADLVRGLLRYEPETGKLFWLVDRNQNKLAGDEAGSLERKTGYLRVTIGSQRAMAHRLIWLIVTGEWPKDRIDHKNRDRSDNRWENLREATDSTNRANIKVSKTNELGVKGVRLHECGKYVARIMKNQKSHYLGVFDTLEGAKDAYARAAAEHFGEFARTG